MIRAWLATARAERVAARARRGERAWRRDLHEHPDERDAFRLAQIAGLRESNADLRLQLAIARRELATYKTRDWLLLAAASRARLADERTAEVSAEQLQRSRPIDAPTEQYRRPR